VSRRRWIAAAFAIVILAGLVAVARNQLKVYRNRQARAAAVPHQDSRGHPPSTISEKRQALFDLLQPVALSNCKLERFGEPHDGGYLMCGNLLGDVRAGYSYGIAGYDKWGCDLSTTLNVTLHQYDCFDTTRPSCPAGRTIFHEECVAERARRSGMRRFDTVTSQIAKNGDAAKRLVVKIDVEGAEWDSLLFAPDDTLRQIDQMAIEFHWLYEKDFQWLDHHDKYLHVVQRLKQFFEVAHVHFNNASCVDDLQPFPSWAYEVLFVNKRLASVDPSRQVRGRHPLDAPNNPAYEDCQGER
jgi:hypothetical protein